MKIFFKNLVYKILYFRAKKVLKNTKTIIGITGSIGKTSTRMAIADVLQTHSKVQTSTQNFNTPLGLLLSILNINRSGSNTKEWLGIMKTVWIKPLPKPDILILEYGVDAPGDMDELLKIAIPDITILTPVALAHTGAGQFQNIQEIRTEKIKLALSAKRKVFANGFDHETTKVLLEKIPQKIKVFGLPGEFDVGVSEAHSEEVGFSFRIDNEYCFAPVYGKFQAQIFAPAFLLGKEFKISVEEIKGAIGSSLPPAGRGRIIPGINESMIWDFSYNSSPTATTTVLISLPEIPGYSRKIALIGNMNELGKRSSEEHRKLGKIAEEYADYVFFVGKNSVHFISGIREKSDRVQVFGSAREVGEFLKDFLRHGDLLLVKGSQNRVFLEDAVLQVLRNPKDKKLLCRQSSKWESIRNDFFSFLL